MASDEQVVREVLGTQPPINDPTVGYALPFQVLPDTPSEDNFTFTPPQLKYSQEHLTNGEYSQYTQDISYHNDTGMRVAMVGAGLSQTTSPVNNQPITHEAVRVGKEITYMVITGTAERSQNWPKIPHWDVQNSSFICIAHRIQLGNPHQIVGGFQVYRLSWVYIYRVLKPFTDTVYMPAATSPVETETSAMHAVNPAVQLDKTLNDMSWLQNL